ncbi:MAG: hypothetical protein LBF22_12550 [Deltaproteobacteria bacterium]|jgi:hypothetical protein|nr:hypothetical protein [Deltaproteobacteria bacterium]
MEPNVKKNGTKRLEKMEPKGGRKWNKKVGENGTKKEKNGNFHNFKSI